jgi:hypothetical protein
MRSLAAQFATLLPTRRRYVGAVVSHNADGTSTIQLTSGAFRAKGQSVPIGQQAEIEDGAVMRKAVTLPTYALGV